MSKTSQANKAKRQKLLPKDRVVRLNETGYWSGNHRWQTVPIEKATHTDRARAESVRRNMRKIGYTQASIEIITPL